jgi:predicted ester cyclase
VKTPRCHRNCDRWHLHRSIVSPTGKKIQFETVDAMRVHNGKIKDYWGVANLYSLMQQLGASTMTASRGL